MISIRLFFLPALLLLTLSLDAQNEDRAVRDVKAALKAQGDAWNRGDLEGFMKYYWQSPDLQFIGSRGLTTGYAPIFQNYRRSYPDQNAMGRLTFQVLSADKRSGKVVSMVGKWSLQRKAKDPVGGYFLLIWQKIKSDWVIVSDHTNVESKE